MTDRRYFFTSESINEGHPDKVADQISDGILDAYLTQDPYSRVACETMVTTGRAFLAGEITSKGSIDHEQVVRDTVKNIGYDSPEKGFDYKTCDVQIFFDEQSPDIAQGVNDGEGLYTEQGAGDQGIMFGFASNETEELMPMPISYSHRLSRRLTDVRKDGTLGYLRPDGKTQVTIEYVGNTPQRIDTVVVSTQHDDDVSLDQIREDVIAQVVRTELPANLLDDKTRFLINPTGRFVLGGPHADCGLTGRKIIADTYGGMGSHGGGAFSGKDPSKVDRSASYMARYIAKNLVACGVLDRCEVQVAYAIGYPDPVSFLVNDYGTAKIDPAKIEEVAREVFPLKPACIVKQLDLLKPRYSKTAAYGHFGRTEDEFSWERTDRVDALKNLFNI